MNSRFGKALLTHLADQVMPSPFFLFPFTSIDELETLSQRSEQPDQEMDNGDEDEDTPPNAIVSSSRMQLDSPPSSSSLQASSPSDLKIEFILSDLKTAIKLKSRHPSFTAKQKKEGKKLYRRMKRFLKSK